MAARLGRMQLQYVVIVRTPQPPAAGAGDVNGVVTAAGTVVGARADAGDVAGAVTASATVVGTVIGPAVPAQPVVVSVWQAAFAARTILEPTIVAFAQVVPPAGAGDVTGAATASATVVGARADAGDVTGVATASATVAGSSVGPPQAEAPIVVS